jgi:hypothetical protein
MEFDRGMYMDMKSEIAEIVAVAVIVAVVAAVVFVVAMAAAAVVEPEVAVDFQLVERP